ncbi:2TM domain-containing protein [Candidatus Chlorohelix sp.]|uniref:2TM domain-containing protein n=1 Tax=Candidatus Chlorohelix sp. TaxID=3139201 RepID=UPI00304E6BAB
MNYDVSSPEYREAYRMAERRVKAKIGFYWHLASYVIVNGMLIAIYLLTTMPVGGLYYPWFVWPMLGWGIGLLFHFLGVYVFASNNSPVVRQRMIEEELRKMGTPVPPPGVQWPTTNYGQANVPDPNKEQKY